MFSFNGKNLDCGISGVAQRSWDQSTNPFALTTSSAAPALAGAVLVSPQESMAHSGGLASSIYMARAVGATTDDLSALKNQEAAAPGEGEVASSPDSAPEEASDEDLADFEEQSEDTSPNVSAKDIAKAAFLKTLQRAKEGDRKAFEEIYQLYHRRIYNAVYGMLGDADDAQDVTQDVFIRLHDALPTLRADEAFSTYLYRIALNLCRDRARRKKRVRFQSMDTARSSEDGEMEPMEFPDAGKLPEEQLTGDELQNRVREAVSTLSEDHKAVIVMHHFQGMEVNDIADILGVPSGTVKSRLARGREQLHRKLRTYLSV